MAAVRPRRGQGPAAMLATAGVHAVLSIVAWSPWRGAPGGVAAAALLLSPVALGVVVLQLTELPRRRPQGVDALTLLLLCAHVVLVCAGVGAHLSVARFAQDGVLAGWSLHEIGSTGRMLLLAGYAAGGVALLLVAAAMLWTAPLAGVALAGAGGVHVAGLVAWRLGMHGPAWVWASRSWWAVAGAALVAGWVWAATAKAGP